MAKAQNSNLALLMRVIDKLGALSDEIVFLGGCAMVFLITDPAALPKGLLEFRYSLEGLTA